MMIRTSTAAAISALMLTACGQAGEPATESEAPSPRLEASTASAPAEDGPEIGERIVSGAELVEVRDDSLAAAARREAERKAALEARGVREIGWEELMPAGEEEKLAELYREQMAMLYSSGPIVEGSAADAMVQIGTFNTVPELNGLKVRLPGYTVPFDFAADARIEEFLLVPYFGACIHAPPPPPNQTVFVIADEPLQLKDLAQAVWIEGTLYAQTQESELADAAYTIQLERLEEYEY